MRSSFAFAARRVAARVAVSSVASVQAGFVSAPSSGSMAAPMAVVTGSLCQHRFNMTRPGDWTCGGCGFSNFGSRTVCKNCAAPRPSAGGAPAGGGGGMGVATEWRCPSCQLSNPADVAYCVACSFAKPSAPSAGGGAGMEGRTAANLDAKPGDWLCSKCAFHNFRRNATCRQCGSPKPDGPPTMVHGGGGAPAAGGAAGGPSTFMKGDWTCVGCGDHNFAKRTTCRACGAERVKLSNPDGKKPAQVLANDWNCPSCAVNNFARRTECFKCGTAKPAGSSTTSAAE